VFFVCERKLFKEIEPYNSGMLKVSDLHTLYYEEVGNPEGKPIVVFHGGPGAGISTDYRRYFDPLFYRIILFDQRGAGKSTPHAELKDNTTEHLIEDIEKLRVFLNIQKWVVLGGSWGTTLALSYGIKHPDKVYGLILRGIFLGRKEDINWLYQEGASNIYPDKWENYKKIIPEDERYDYVTAYYNRLTSNDEKIRMEAAKAWSIWEGSVVNLLPNEETVKAFGESDLALSIARLECHYFYNNMFNDNDNYILENIDKIKDIPCRIVHGRYDMDCRLSGAWELQSKLNNSKLCIVKDAGHSGMEPGTISELVNATEEFKKLY